VLPLRWHRESLPVRSSCDFRCADHDRNLQNGIARATASRSSPARHICASLTTHPARGVRACTRRLKKIARGTTGRRQLGHFALAARASRAPCGLPAGRWCAALRNWLSRRDKRMPSFFTTISSRLPVKHKKTHDSPKNEVDQFKQARR